MWYLSWGEVLATKIDGNLPPKFWFHTLSGRKFLKICTLFWSINQCYCFRTMELPLFHRFLLFWDNRISKTKGFLAKKSKAYLVLEGKFPKWSPCLEERFRKVHPDQGHIPCPKYIEVPPPPGISTACAIAEGAKIFSASPKFLEQPN